MDKEKIITISIGLFVGLLGAGAYFLLIKNSTIINGPPKKQVIEKKVVETQKPTQTTNTTFNWETPQDLSIFQSKAATISGTATPGSRIVIISSADQDSIVADNNGKFSVEIALESAQNKITLTNFVPGQTPITLSRDVFLEL